MRTKACVVVNPNAGSAGEAEALRERLEASMPDAAVRFTEQAGDARELAREAARDGCGLVVAAGGDGTLNEVVDGLADGSGGFLDAGLPRLGLLPLGTGNDFARSIGVPADLDGALAILEAGRARRMDVGRATIGGGADGSRCFLNMAVGGFSPVVSEKADEAKDRWGALAYLRGAVGALPELHEFRAVLTLSGAERLEMDLYNLVLANGRTVASGIPVAPQAVLDDGLLEVMVVPAASFPQLARLIPQILLGRHLESDLAVFRRATRVEVESTPPMAFNVDGEVIGESGSAVFELLPRALEVVVGPEEP